MKQKLVDCASVPARLPEAVAREVDEICKGLPQDVPYMRKAYVPEATQFEPGERSEVSILTTATKDKTNEVVLPEGVELDHYRKSKIVLYNHDQHAVVGENVWIKHVPKDNSIRAKTTYYENAEGVESKWYAFVDETWQMVKAGALKAKSIGFQPLVPKREATPEELAAHPDWAGVGIWPSCLLLEYSVCSIGICNDALVQAVNTKSLSVERLKEMGFEVCMPPEVIEAKAGLDPGLVREAINYARHGATVVFDCRTRLASRAKKPGRDINQLLAKALDSVELDVGAILTQAADLYGRRGKV